MFLVSLRFKAGDMKMTPEIRKGEWLGFVQTRSNFICKDEKYIDCAFALEQNCIIASTSKATERPYCLLFTGGKQYSLRLCFIRNGVESYIRLQEEIPKELRRRTTTIAEVRRWWFITGIKILRGIENDL